VNALAGACPVCELSRGFHDHRVHAERVTIPARLLISKTSS
jgi:hypothetical protein